VQVQGMSVDEVAGLVIGQAGTKVMFFCWFLWWEA
jgi:hypothetical protein